MNKQLEEFKARLNTLGAEFKALAAQSEIDWSKMPVDTLVEARHAGDSWVIRYFSKVSSADRLICFDSGRSSLNQQGEGYWDEIRLIENKPVFWEGGECPVPDGVRVKVWYRDGDTTLLANASAEVWFYTESDVDIIAYQILGEE